jgi:hypothetical protein
MKRLLSHILLLSLLVIAPVSFSTDAIPCFDVPATHSSSVHESLKTDITVVHQAVKMPELLDSSFSTPHRFTSAPEIFVYDYHLGMKQGRAPPVVPATYTC